MIRSLSGRTGAITSTDESNGLTITVQPSKRAYFAGEQFEAVFKFANQKPKQPDRRRSLHVPREKSSEIGRAASTENEEGPSRLGLIGKHINNPHTPEWREKFPRSRTRQASEDERSQLGGNGRQDGIPRKHAHARKPSTIVPSASSPPPVDSRTLSPVSTPTLPSISEHASSKQPASESPDVDNEIKQPRPSHRRTASSMISLDRLSFSLSRTSLDIGSRNGAPGLEGSSTSIINVQWAHARLRGSFLPSTAHIPPDPLLPLRSILLHQPVGSGSLAPPGSNSPGWSLPISFGTGTLPGQSQPSLTGSLFGLAKGIVGVGGGGSLEEERRKVWTSRELPVFETLRSLVAVEMRLDEGEDKEFSYKIILPAHLPPTFRGQALRFQFDLELVVNVDGRVHTFHEPVRIWPYVAIPRPSNDVYDILDPIVQRTEKGVVASNLSSSRPDSPASRRPSVVSLLAGGDDEAKLSSLRELQTYTKQLLEGNETSSNGLRAVDARFSAAVNTLLAESGPASFEMVDEGQTFAKVHLSRTTVSVGQTLSAEIEVLKPIGKFSCFLTCNETIPSHLLPPPMTESERPPVLQKSVTDRHFDNVLDASSFKFTLTIPEDITPSFRVAAADGKRGGIEWRLDVHFLVLNPSYGGLTLDYRDSDSEFFASYLANSASRPVAAKIPLIILPSPCEPNTTSSGENKAMIFKC